VCHSEMYEADMVAAGSCAHAHPILPISDGAAVTIKLAQSWHGFFSVVGWYFRGTEVITLFM
jgi:hypothetical protein